jgi:hypothetical protein
MLRRSISVWASLNGCECQSSQSHIEGGRTVTTTHKLRIGYISRDCFAFVYRLVCAMRDIPTGKFLIGLSSDAKGAVSQCGQEYGNWFKPEYRHPENIARAASELTESVMSCQDDAAIQHRLIRRLEESIKTSEARIYNGK